MINIAEKAKKQGINFCTLGFSTGKDSVIGLDLLLKAGIEVLPIYCYIVPQLEFVEKNIALYEKYYGIKVVRMPHPMLYDHIRRQDWQDLFRTRDIAKTYAPSKITFANINWLVLHDRGLNVNAYDANCMKMADSFNRRVLLRAKPDIDDKKRIIYLAKYLTDKEIFEYIKQNDIPLTKDYEIFGRSWDGLAYHFLTGVKKNYPNDFKKIQEFFPLIEAEIYRYKTVTKHKKYENIKQHSR
jgi:hypothetical protein